MRRVSVALVGGLVLLGSPTAGQTPRTPRGRVIFSDLDDLKRFLVEVCEGGGR
jgi:hypothetical protein